MKIYIGTDHAGFEMKEKLKSFLGTLGYEVEDKGAFAFDAEDDYPDFIFPVAHAVAEDMEARGIILGGSGQGEAMAANRVKGIRAAVVNATGHASEIAGLARQHNNANIISLGARFLTEEEAEEAVRTFLTTEFKNEERHVRRINKLDTM